MAHPLSNHPDWLFWQPEISVKGTVLILPEGEQAPEVRSFWATHTCREGLITNIKSGMSRHILHWQKPRLGQPLWKVRRRRGARIRLYDSRVYENLVGANLLGVPGRNLLPLGEKEKAAPSKNTVQRFQEVCDALVGVPSVLLSPNRPPGEWWREHVAASAEKQVPWSATDNWFMRHPALLSIATGLFRQAVLLTKQGFADRVLECVRRSEVEEALTTADWRLAYKLALQLRPWIEVPCGKGGSRINYPFPLGLWSRFEYLQRAQRRHNYQKIFGESFYESWNLTAHGSGTAPSSGAFSVWGRKSEYTDARARLRKLGAARRRSRRGKQAAEGT